MDQHEHERTRDDAPEQNDRSPEPGTIHHARSHLHDFAGNECHDDLHKLHGQKDEEAEGTSIAHVVDYATKSTRLENLMNVGPDQNNNKNHQREKCDESAELENVTARHLAAADCRDFLSLLSDRFATLVGTFFRSLAMFAGALEPRRRLLLRTLIVRRGFHLRFFQTDATVAHFRIAPCITLQTSCLVVPTGLVELFLKCREHAARRLQLAANRTPNPFGCGVLGSLLRRLFLRCFIRGDFFRNGCFKFKRKA